MPACGRMREISAGHKQEGQAPAATRGVWPLFRLRSRTVFAASACRRADWPASPQSHRRRRRGGGARRQLGCPLPDRSVVELDGHAIRGVDRAEICPGDPDAARVVHPAAGGLAGLVDQVEFPAVLGDEGEVARAGRSRSPACIDMGRSDSRLARRRRLRSTLPTWQSHLVQFSSPSP